MASRFRHEEKPCAEPSQSAAENVCDMEDMYRCGDNRYRVFSIVFYWAGRIDAACRRERGLIMQQLISYYRMPHDNEDEIQHMVEAAGFDGVENLIYGTTPAKVPFSHVTKGVHLRFWPYWMDFYRGNKERLAHIFQDEEAIAKCYGGLTVDDWIETQRKNIQAALAEKPAYLVWHVQESTPEEAWTWKFHYSDLEVLKAAAEVYHAVSDLIPCGVRVFFENIFWPGLFHMEPEKVDYFFSEVNDESHTGIMFDTGHFMNTVPGLTTEEEGAEAISSMVRNLGSLSSLIHGIHLSASLSGIYRKTFRREYPKPCTPDILMRHITSIDQHRPFETSAARYIVECIQPEYVVHEIFGNTFAEAIRRAKGQKDQLRM